MTVIYSSLAFHGFNIIWGISNLATSGQEGFSEPMVLVILWEAILFQRIQISFPIFSVSAKQPLEVIHLVSGLW